MPKPLRSLFLATLIVLVLGAGVSGLILWRAQESGPDLDPAVTELTRQVAAIEAAEEEVARTIWAPELLAQQCGRVIDDLWDALNASTNPIQELARFPVTEVVLPRMGAPTELPHAVQLYEQIGSGEVLNLAGWQAFLAETERAGWRLAQSEWRHLQFDRDIRGEPDKSGYYFSAHLAKASGSERLIIEGSLHLDWQPAAGFGQGATVRRVEVRDLTLRQRAGEPLFSRVFYEKVAPPEGSFFIDPLILYDLDGDGLSEIILAASNLVLHRGPDGGFDGRPLCRYPPRMIFTGMLADFDGDGTADFLCAKFEGLHLFRGSPGGRFDEPGRLVWAAAPRLKYGQTITCGDIDGDGDLDVWLGQYKVPYDRGQMPTPYYDANDGHPSFLLLNDGQGNFTDATVAAGLAKKRWRRAYSGSLVDFTGDGHLDLVAVSDFAGLELYANDGKGRFTEVTDELIAERHGFGMSQVVADLDGDGLLDLLMIGMNVPVADRLRHLGLARPGFESYLSMAGPMTYGNRLFLQQPAGSFRQTALNDPIARTGWSWACSAFDFDNDGFADLYIANGHETQQSVREYEPEFWLHDIYVGNSRDNLAAFAYFRAKAARTRGRGMSYGGYERNRFFWNHQGRSFVEMAFLMGLALGEDSRNVVADDLNGDGRLDLIVTTFEAWPHPQQTLQIFENKLENPGNWIGFRLEEQGGGVSPAGARITLRYAGKTAVRQLVAGDSYRSQQASTAHFGLGQAQEVESAEIRWPDGRSRMLRAPPVNQYLNVTPPGGDAQPRSRIGLRPPPGGD